MAASRRWLLALVVIWSGMTLLADPRGNFPLNDDWVYARVVDSIFSPGGLSLAAGNTAASLVAQAYWGALFHAVLGPSLFVLRVSTLVLGLAGVVATFALLSEVGARPSRAFAGALTLAVNPMYFGLSNTFMTDVPFTALAITSVWLLVRGWQRDDSRATMIGLVMAGLSVFVRQVGAAIFLGYAVATLLRRGNSVRGWAAAFGPLLAVVALLLLFQSWLAAGGRTSPALNQQALDLGRLLTDGNPGAVFRRGWRIAFDGALFAAVFAAPLAIPLAVARLSREGEAQRRRVGLIAASGVVLVMALLVRSHHFLPVASARVPPGGNVLEPFGLGPLTLRDVYILHLNLPAVGPVTAAIWQALTLVGVISLVSMAGLVGAVAADACRLSRREALRQLLVPLFLVTVVVTYMGPVILTNDYYDRYYLPIAPLALAAVVACARGVARSAVSRRLEIAGAVLLAGWAIFATLAAHDYLAWNRVRWQTTSALVRDQRIAPSDVDGGYEFNGSYLYRPGYVAPGGKSWWWVANDTYVLALGPLPGYEILERHPVNRWLPVGPAEILVLRAPGRP